MSKNRKNPRLCRVQMILPSQYVNTITGNDSVNARATRAFIYDKSIDIKKNVDDNTSLIQKDLVTSTNRLESLIEKVMYLSIISIVVSTITLCIC